MSTEDALFRTVRDTAEDLLAAEVRSGRAIDLELLAEKALAKFRRIIDLDNHAAALRMRIKAHLQNLVARHPPSAG
jgi:hypothetical protein